MQATVSPEQRRAAKREIVRRIEQGASAKVARLHSAVPMHRATVYRLLKRVQSEATTRPPLTGSSEAVRQRLLLTLLFLDAVGLHRTWDLRGYTAAGLALLTGRRSAYGYRYTEAFLSQLAHAGGAERLTDALARWTTQVWHAPDETPEQPGL